MGTLDHEAEVNTYETKIKELLLELHCEKEKLTNLEMVVMRVKYINKGLNEELKKANNEKFSLGCQLSLIKNKKQGLGDMQDD